MSLNKWKAWPMENLEDVLKIDKMSDHEKRILWPVFGQNKKFAKLNKYAEYLS